MKTDIAAKVSSGEFADELATGCSCSVTVSSVSLSLGRNYPTLYPTVAPSAVPIPAPSAEPSQKPTPSPTQAPSPVPFPAPTAQPFPLPTAEPTHIPTSLPTPYPSPLPTAHPTHSPTQPSPLPSASPTPHPTAYPTALPSGKPTHVPTPSPTHYPTMEHPPSPFPSARPTHTPSQAPTHAPTTFAEKKKFKKHHKRHNGSRKDDDVTDTEYLKNAPMDSEARLSYVQLDMESTVSAEVKLRADASMRAYEQFTKEVDQARAQTARTKSTTTTTAKKVKVGATTPQVKQKRMPVSIFDVDPKFYQRELNLEAVDESATTSTTSSPTTHDRFSAATAIGGAIALIGIIAAFVSLSGNDPSAAHQRRRGYAELSEDFSAPL
jgi:hypothetical protein